MAVPSSAKCPRVPGGRPVPGPSRVPFPHVQLVQVPRPLVEGMGDAPWHQGARQPCGAAGWLPGSGCLEPGLRRPQSCARPRGLAVAAEPASSLLPPEGREGVDGSPSPRLFRALSTDAQPPQGGVTSPFYRRSCGIPGDSLAAGPGPSHQPPATHISPGSPSSSGTTAPSKPHPRIGSPWCSHCPW